MCTSQCYRIAKIILFLGYLIFCSFYASNLSATKYWFLELANRVFMFSVIFQYVLELLAFGMRGRKREFIFETVACLYVLGASFYKERFDILNSGDSISRALSGIVIFFQIFRYLKRNFHLT